MLHRNQRWSRGHKARGQGQGQKKKSEAKAKDRNARGQGRRTQAQVLYKKKKTSSEKIFRRSLEKKVFQKIFQALHKLITTQKIVLFSSREQGNFRGLEASRPRART